MNYDIATKEGMCNSVNWLNAHLSRIREGGVWMIPRSGTCYTINHKDKEATKTVSMLPDPSLDKVFLAAGWTVKGLK